MLLAIDTSAGTSVAVVDRDAGVLAVRGSEDPRRHAELIGDFIRDTLDEAGVAPRRLSAVAIGMGPGPFTGLRVGIAAGRAFALGIGRPVVALVSHDAIAAEEEGELLVLTDARRRELAWSHYAPASVPGIPKRVEGPALVLRDAADALRARFPSARVIAAPAVDAARLGMLAERRFAAGLPFAPDEPVYLRPPDATPSDGPKRVTA